MKKRESSEERSSSQEGLVKRKSRIMKKQHSDEEKVPEKTRSRHKLSYNHHPQEYAENKDSKKLKKELKIEKKYMVDAKEQEKKVIEKKEVKEMETEMLILTKEEEQRQKIVHKTGQIPLTISKSNPIKNLNTLKILDEADTDAGALVQMMTQAYQFDKTAYKKGKIACQRIRCFEIIKQKIRNLYLKRKFIEKGGLEQFCLWFLPIKNKQGKIMQPSIAVKMGILRIIQEMGLESYQITEYASGLWQVLKNNRRDTKIPELKSLCSQILNIWDFTLFKKYQINAK